MATHSGTPDAKFQEKSDDDSERWLRMQQRTSVRERWPHAQEKPSELPNQPLVRSGVTRSSGAKSQDGNRSKQLPHHTTSKVNETSGRVGAESKTMVPAQVETTQSSTLPQTTPRVRQIPQLAPNQESKDLEINPRQQANKIYRWSYTAPAEATQSSTRSRASSHVQKMPQPCQQPSKNNRWSVSIPVETPISSTLPQTSRQTPPPTPTRVVSKPPAEAQLNTTQTHIDGKHSTTESLEVCTSVHSYK